MNRFHNKYHRHNHHSNPTAGEPDSSHDPIASKDDPFQGEFHVKGEISGTSAGFDKLTASDVTITNNLTVKGNVSVESPITYILEHLTIVPKSTTQDFYFKIDSQFTDHPLTEIYLNGACVFMITTAKDVGIGTCNPTEKLDVIGNVKCFNFFASSATLTANLAVSGGSHFNSITADNTSQIGYLEIGYVPNMETYIKTISGNKDLFVYTGNNLNLKMHPNNNNMFTGKLGIGMEPIERFTLSGQMGFRQNGLVLLDNSYFDTLRIITHRSGDDNQHLFTFTYDGRYVVGDVFHDYTYAPCGNKIADHKVNIIDAEGGGNLLSLTNITSSADHWTAPTISLFRTNGDLTDVRAVSTEDHIGAIRAFGYNTDTCYGNRNASIEFVAANDYTKDLQGAYTIFETTCASDTTNTPFERVRVDHNGNVGINTNNFTAFTPSVYPYRNTIRPDWKFTVRDYDLETRPAAVIFAGVSASPMMQIIGGEDVLEQTGLMLSDRNITDNNTNHITFTHGSADAHIARVSSLNRGAEGINGGSLLFGTTYRTQTIGTLLPQISTLPFERMRLNFNGDLGIGSRSPNSRLHVHDDNKLSNQAAGFLRDVVTVSTLNNTNGILLSSVDLQSRAFNNNASKTLFIETATTGGMIKFNSDNESYAAVITDQGTVGINVDEKIDLYTTTLQYNDVKLGIKGDVILFNSEQLPGGLSEVAGVSRDLLGNFFISQPGEGNVVRFNTGTTSVTAISASDGKAWYATATDRNNKLYIADSLTITRLNTTFNVDSTFVIPGPGVITGLVSNPTNVDELFVLVTDTATASVKTLNTVTNTVTVVATFPWINSTLEDEFGGLTIDSSSNLFVTHTGAHNILKITLTGIVTVFAGSSIAVLGNADGNGGSALFNFPAGIGIDNADNLYVCDSGNKTIRKITPAGDVTTFFTSAGTPLGQIAVDGANTIFFTNYESPAEIVQVTSAGVATTLVTGSPSALTTPDPGQGARLFFSKTLVNQARTDYTDPLYIHRRNTPTLDIAELRINIGDDSCPATPTGTPPSYVNTDVLAIGNYPGGFSGTGTSGRKDPAWDRWVDIGSCSTVLHNNLSAMKNVTIDGDTTIKGTLSVINTANLPTKFFGDVYVDGNIFATGDITGFCGCTPPGGTTSTGVIVPPGWPWAAPHPPVTLPPIIPSDARLKLNPTSISDSLDKVMLINGVFFDWDETKQKTYKGRDVGVIAQEIEKILPEIVHERADGYKGVQYEKIIPLLIECIKDLKKEIDLLKSK